MMTMIAKVLLFYLIACFGTNILNAESDDCSVCGNGPADFPLIPAVKGGLPIPSTKSFPWVVALRHDNTTNYCVGAILDEYFILTAAHCITDPEGKPNRKLSVYFQTESKEQLSKAAAIENMVVHPRFRLILSHVLRSVLAKYDIGLIKLKEKIKCNKYRRSICLPETHYKVPADEIFHIAGWCLPESQENNVLQYGILRSLQFEACLKRAPDIGELKDHMLCLGKTAQTTCPGDSGGPLMNKINDKYTVFGILSSTTSKDLKVEDPVMFTNVAVFVDWIEEEKRKLLKPPSPLVYKGENVEEKSTLQRFNESNKNKTCSWGKKSKVQNNRE